MDKLYERINWENEPSISTPLNEINLNKMDYSIDAIDDRVITIDTTKAKQSDLLQSLKTVTYDTSSGVFLFTWNNGTTLTVDLNIEKIPVSFSMSEAGVITMTTADGSTYTADVASLIKTYSFTDSSRIDFTVTTDASGNKTVQADIVDGSITSSKIEASLVANINNANNYAISSKSYAVGGTGTRSGENTDNSKYYYEQARQTDVGQLVPRVTNLETGLSNTMESLTHQKDSGYLQKNLWDEKSKSGYYNATSGTYIYSIDYFCNTNPIYVKASTRMHIVDGSGKVRALLYKADGTFLGTPYTLNVGTWTDFTTTSDCAYINIYANDSSYANNIAILYGTSGTYTPYAMPNTDLTKDINDIDASMKMLGWTLPDSLKGMNYIDSNGVFHQKIDRAKLGNLTCNKIADNTFDFGISNLKNSATRTVLLYAKGYENKHNSESFDSSWNKVCFNVISSNVNYVRFIDKSYNDASAFKTYVSDIYVYYELATEITKNVDGNEIAPSLKESLHNVGQTYTASWIATSTTQVGTQLTSSVTVPDGVYIAEVCTPFTNTETVIMVSINGATVIGGFNGTNINSNMCRTSFIIKANGSVYVTSNSGNAVSWSSTYLSRGALNLIRIA